MVLAAIDGHCFAAVTAYLATSHCTASVLSGPPRKVTKSGSADEAARSFIHSRSTFTVWAVSGVALSLRPLPVQRTCGPEPSWMSCEQRPVSSLTRRPVWAASTSRA